MAFSRRKELMIKKILLAAVAAVLLSRSTYGQAQLTFSGGNGSSLSVTLVQPISLTITSPVPGGFAPWMFVFDAVGSPPINAGTSVTFSSNISFSINSASPRRIEFMDSGVNGGDVTPDDLNIFHRSSVPALGIGDMVTLNAGTIMSMFATIAAPPPADGNYNAFITRGDNRLRVSTYATPVPEPGSVALAVIGAAGLIVLMRRSVRPFRG